MKTFFSKPIQANPNINAEVWYQEYWSRMFSSKKYLKGLLKDQQEIINNYELLLEQIQEDINNKCISTEELLNDIRQKAFSANYRYRLTFKGSVPDDVEKR